MKEKINSFLKEIEKNMACVAYAEAGEACPLDNEQNENLKKARCMNSVADSKTCRAYAKAGLSCPVCGEA